MFIGHFAAAFAAKKIDPKPSLGTYFLAAQWLDLLWPVFLLTGTETVFIARGNAVIPLTFTHYPISHSLLVVVLWSMLLGAVYYLIRKNRKGAVLIGLLVLSHWFFDWIVHVPDLPLTPFGNTKVGWGLWNYPYLELLFELFLFTAGVFIYVKETSPKNKTGTIAMWALVIFLLVIHVISAFGPPPPSIQSIAIMGLAQWLLVAWAYWVDRNRQPI